MEGSRFCPEFISIPRWNSAFCELFSINRWCSTAITQIWPGTPAGCSNLARAIDRLGVSSWDRLDTITRNAVSTRLDGGTFRVRPFARKVSVQVPAEAQTIQIEAPEHTGSVLTRRASEGRVGWRAGEALEDPSLGGDLLEIVLEAPDSPELPPASRSGWPPIRRMITESRDRAQALRPE